MASELNSKNQRNYGNRENYWPLQNAKARFSELLRRVKSDGPQHVTVHGREEVVVITADEFRRLKGDLTGSALVEACRLCPEHDWMPQVDELVMPISEPVIF